MSTPAPKPQKSASFSRLALRLALSLAGLVGLAATGNVLRPPRSTPLSEGDVLHSELEGFTATVLRVDALCDVEVRMGPHAVGPPVHVHTTFDETFVVQAGTASLSVAGRTITLGPSDRYTVPRGTPHAPFNATGEVVVMHTALPHAFASGLASFYPAMDAVGDLDSPRVLLVLAAEGPEFDTFSPGAPIVLQRALRWVLGPLGR